MQKLLNISSTVIGSFGLVLFNMNSASADENTPSAGAASPEAVEYNFILEQVQKKGAKGNDLTGYMRQCNGSGICSYTKPAVEERSVVYHTPFGTQKVVYSSYELEEVRQSD